MKVAEGTFTAYKLKIAVPKVIILGHQCSYEGWKPDEMHIEKIINWPPCTNLTKV